MSRFYIIANWKMNLGLEESCNLARAVKKVYSKKSIKRKIIICPSFSNIKSTAEMLEDSAISIGAQDLFWEDKGAFTGEVSANQLKEAGCDYVIVGHSERRTIFGETDEMVNKKVLAALRSSLTPIICLGEGFKERKAGREREVITNQVTNALKNVEFSREQHIIIAYEPVWAISTSRQGKEETPEDADTQQKFIKEVIKKIYGEDVLENNFTIIYGGSVSIENIQSFAEKKNIQGALIGGASQKEKSFLTLIEKIKSDF